MRVLIVKQSSMGDLVHVMPALMDAKKAYPEIQFDWVVEEAFSEIPQWHPAVDQIIPIALRRWRKHPIDAIRSGEWGRFWRQLREHTYDAIIDAQGLLKSALVSRFAKGVSCGFDRHSIREASASFLYQKTFSIRDEKHETQRIRQLFSKALNYPLALEETPDYGLDRTRVPKSSVSGRYLVFIHGASWDNKCWPESEWIKLAAFANQAGYSVYLPWGNQKEHDRATRIASTSDQVSVLPKLALGEVLGVISGAQGTIGVDTGFTYLAGALAVPAVTLYGPTKAERVRIVGPTQVQLTAKFSCAPCMRRQCAFEGEPTVFPACFSALPSEQVWGRFKELL